MSGPKPRRTPTARTLEELRRRGWPGQTVEKWVTMRGGDGAAERAGAGEWLLMLADSFEPGSEIISAPEVTAGLIRRAVKTLSSTIPAVRKDFLGCIDILALDGLPGSLGIQACAGASASERAKKAAAEPLLKAWLAAGNRFQVWAWRETWVSTGAKTKAQRWRPRVVELYLDDPADLETAQIVSEEIEAGSDGRTPGGASLGAGLEPRAIPPPGPAGSGPAPGLFDDLEGA